MAPKKSLNPIDKHLGDRVRMRRLMMEINQEKLANALGITFQQLQKYEKGTNRISASRLQQISRVLQVPITFFFDEAPHEPVKSTSSKKYLQSDQSTDFIATREGVRLVQAFMRIANAQVRRRILLLVEEIEKHED